MAYRKKTLRRMQPVTRRYARVLNDLDGVLRRLKNLTEDIARLEMDSTALLNKTRWEKDAALHAIHDPISDHTTIDEAADILFGKEDNDEL